MKVPRLPAVERKTQDRPGPPRAFELSAEDKRTLVRLFLESSHEDLRVLEHAMLAGEFDEVLHRVHRFHGAALTVGATPLVAQLESFERILREALQIPADGQARLAHLRQGLQDYPQRLPGAMAQSASMARTLSRN
jgi:HPt (histidine-containing phosphotransfer) domain-containing protein